MLIGIVVVLLFLVALLAIPVTLRFQVWWPQVVQSDIRMHWAFGLVRARIPSFAAKKAPPKAEETDHKAGRVESSSRRKGNYVAAIRQKSFRRRIIRFHGDLWRAVHKKQLNIRVRIGLGDPADTGQLWAVVGPVSTALANVQEASITIEPDFLDTTLELDSSGVIRIIPLQMIYLAGALLLSPPVWQGIKKIRSVGQ